MPSRSRSRADGAGGEDGEGRHGRRSTGSPPQPWPEDGFGLDRMRRCSQRSAIPSSPTRGPVVGTKGKSTATVTVEQLLHADGFAMGRRLAACALGERPDHDPGTSGISSRPCVASARTPERLGATQFESITAAALAAFADAAVDVAVVEAGLGGRHDATNVLRPASCCSRTSGSSTRRSSVARSTQSLRRSSLLSILTTR